MSDTRKYLDMLAGLTAYEPLDIDALVFDDQSATEGSILPGGDFVPSAVIWHPLQNRKSRIGVRITEPPGDPRLIAARLAAIAVERGVYPVLISHIGITSLHLFGFRTEQVAGTTEQEIKSSEEQVTRFWNLAIVIDARELAAFG